MSDPARSSTGARVLGVAQLAAGSVLLAAPTRMAVLAAGPDGVRVPAWIVRVLGARMAGQGALEAAMPTRAVTVLGLAADGLHAASMFALAAAQPRYRRVGVIAALPATVAAIRGAQIVRGGDA